MTLINSHVVQSSLGRFPWRLACSFFCLGVINNVLYVMILSAALDLVGVDTPKSVVLLANILPSVGVKLVAPYLFEYIAWTVRVWSVVGVNFAGMVLVSQSQGLAGKLVGIGMASAASGAGEITFLQISHSYPAISLAAWASGTGGAGILGGLLYVGCTTWLRISPARTLMGSAVLPLVMALTYFVFLPPVSNGMDSQSSGRRSLAGTARVKYSTIGQAWEEEEEEEDSMQETTDSHLSDHPPFESAAKKSQQGTFLFACRDKAKLARPLILPYMAPLFLVYFAEYTINQGISPTLLFELQEMPFTHYREVYPTYATIYQFGVFLSRSSSPFYRVDQLYLPAIGQCLLLILMLLQAYFAIIPTIYPLFGLIWLEGIFGGLVYVNAFHQVSESKEIEERDKEFSIGVIGVADSVGILTAAVLSLWLEPTICRYQVDHDRPWCKME